MKKYLFVAAGVLFLLLGAIGIFLPILPTTPFLLLAATSFLRGSKRLHRWLTTNKVFGKYIRMYLKYGAVSVRAKIITLVFLWSVIGVSAIFFTDKWWLRGLLGAVAVGVTTHILLLKTLTPEMENEQKD